MYCNLERKQLRKVARYLRESQKAIGHSWSIGITAMRFSMDSWLSESSIDRMMHHYLEKAFSQISAHPHNRMSLIKACVLGIHRTVIDEL